MSTPLTFKPIGVIHSPWKEKFAVPRQPGLVSEARGELELYPDYSHPDTIRGLEGFSFIWILFVFHQTLDKGWHSLVRPPRLGGNEKVGIFASRSTYRPNAIGMSLVELIGIQIYQHQVRLELANLDLLEGTPVLDIKPYLPYAEAKPEAKAGYAQSSPSGAMPVVFSQLAQQQINQVESRHPRLKQLIIQVLAQDPRPAYRRNKLDSHHYAVLLSDFNIRWQISEGCTHVISIELMKTCFSTE